MGVFAWVISGSLKSYFESSCRVYKPPRTLAALSKQIPLLPWLPGMRCKLTAFDRMVVSLFDSALMSPGSTCCPFKKSGAECALNHKTSQGGNWRLPSLPAMSLPLGPNSWSVEVLRGARRSDSALGNKVQMRKEQPCPSSLLRRVTWLYQQGTLHL